MKNVNLILYPKWLAPMTSVPTAHINPKEQYLENHACVIHDGQILDLLPKEQCKTTYSAQFEYNLADHLLLPGLFNGHAHSAMSLMRGFADDHPLMTWLEDYIWPTEGTHVSPEFVKVGTELALCEMLASGVTSFNDMYFFPEVVADILDSTGLRGCLSGPIMEFPTAWGTNSHEYLAKNTEIIQHYKNHPRISAGYGPHAPYTVSDATWEKTIQLAHDNNTWVHTHLHETAFEVEQSLQEHGMRPIARLNKLGLFDVHSQAVHMTQLIEDDIALIKGKKCHIIHCPESNLKLASGFTPLNAIIEAGINFNIGTDGAASNNDLDMISELRTAAILAKAVASNAAALPAYSALYGATRGGALAYGQDKLGAIATGFAADVIAVDLSDLNTQPVYDPIAQFVYAVNSRQISHVWVDGQLVCEHGQVRVIDTSELKVNIQTWRKKLLSA